MSDQTVQCLERPARVIAVIIFLRTPLFLGQIPFNHPKASQKRRSSRFSGWRKNGRPRLLKEKLPYSGTLGDNVASRF
jgi:hypothetical protein